MRFANFAGSWFPYRVHRDIQPEILDTLPADHPAARHNRRDMRLFNRLMGNFRWIARSLQAAGAAPRARIVELAAGDGSLGWHLFHTLPGSNDWIYTGVDLCDRPARWPHFWNWEQGDVREAESLAHAEIVIANHILHQFSESDLERIGTRLGSTTRLLLLNEPARRSLHLWQARLAFVLGMNYVSRHDALTSIRAGFLGDELPSLLGLSPGHWEWQTRTTALGAYRVVARRKEAVS